MKHINIDEFCDKKFLTTLLFDNPIPSFPIGEVIGLAGQTAQFPAFLLDD